MKIGKKFAGKSATPAIVFEKIQTAASFLRPNRKIYPI